MTKKAVSGILLALLSISTLTLALNIQRTDASGSPTCGFVRIISEWDKEDWLRYYGLDPGDKDGTMICWLEEPHEDAHTNKTVYKKLSCSLENIYEGYWGINKFTIGNAGTATATIANVTLIYNPAVFDVREVMEDILWEFSDATDGTVLFNLWFYEEPPDYGPGWEIDPAWMFPEPYPETLVGSQINPYDTFYLDPYSELLTEICVDVKQTAPTQLSIVIQELVDGQYHVKIVVPPAPPTPEPEFDISVSPSSQSVDIGKSVEYEVAVTSLNEFSSQIMLNVSIKPSADIGWTLEPCYVTPPPNGEAISILRVNTYLTTPVDTYEIQITGTGEGIQKCCTASLIINLRPPSKPRNLEATPDYTRVRLYWEPPTDVGSPPVNEYRIYRGTSSGSETFLASVDGTTLEYLDNFVSSDNLYYYYVTAANVAGEGPSCEEIKCSCLESVKGIETVVTINEFTVETSKKSNLLFTIQQNFIIPVTVEGDRITRYYQVQNGIGVFGKPDRYKMSGIVNIWEVIGGKAKIKQHRYTVGDYKETVVLCSTIQDFTLRIENDFISHYFELSTLHNYIFLGDVVADKGCPEVVLVGPGQKGHANIPHVKFLDPTSGHIDAYVLVGSSDWLYGKMQPLPEQAEIISAETSEGLTCFSFSPPRGYFDAMPPAFNNQGFWFTPYYKGPTVLAPAVPSSPSSAEAMTLDLYCPANLSLYDSTGRHVGYNALTNEIDAEIPEIIYIMTEEAEYVMVFNPLGGYELDVIGSGDGKYTLQVDWQNAAGEISTMWNSTGNIVEGAIYSYDIEITDQIYSTRPDPIEELVHLKEFINGLLDDSFDQSTKFAGQLKKALSNKIDEIILKVDAGNYTDAIHKLSHDIRAKMDGDSTAQDWIIDPEAQVSLCIIIDHIISSIETLQHN